MKNIFYEIIEEAKNGQVVINGDFWPIGFNTIIYDNGEVRDSNFSNDNLSTLTIKNENLFFEKLEEYLNLELEKERKYTKYFKDDLYNHKKFLICYLFVNASTEDFLNPVGLLERCIGFLKDNTFEKYNNGVKVSIEDLLKDNFLIIKNTQQSISMETPNKIELYITTKNEIQDLKYKLPEISYGITINDKGEKICYIYSILNKEDKLNSEEQIKYSKRITRLLYKLNNGVSKEENKDYFDYKNGISEYYEENISDVSPSAVLALSIFLTLLQKESVYNVKAIPYLPIRYLSREISANNNSNEEKKIELLKRNDLIQSNITDKYIRTFRRVEHHINGIQIVSYPYEYDECINIKIDHINLESNNEILEEVSKSVNKFK